jgi:hypothetical protein
VGLGVSPTRACNNHLMEESPWSGTELVGESTTIQGVTQGSAGTTVYRLHQGSEIRLHPVEQATVQPNDVPASGAEGIRLTPTGRQWSERPSVDEVRCIGCLERFPLTPTVT